VPGGALGTLGTEICHRQTLDHYREYNRSQQLVMSEFVMCCVYIHTAHPHIACMHALHGVATQSIDSIP
jgi:hypothetical protein